MRGGRHGVWRRLAVVGVIGVIGLAALAQPAWAASAPDIVAHKSTDAVGPQAIGSHFSYTIAVSNQGGAEANRVVLSDNLPAGLRPVTPPLPAFDGGSCTVTSSVSPNRPERWSVYCTRDVLPAGETAAATFGVAVTSDVRCGDVVNVVTAHARNELSADRGNDTASASVEVACPPSLSLAKTAPTYAHEGERVPFTMRVANTGSTPFDHVGVADPGCSGPPRRIGGGNGNSQLEPAETWIYRCSAAIDASTPRVFTSTAIAVGRSPDGNARASARATVRVLRPHLSISVQPDPVSGSPGDTVTYTYVVRNVGDTVLTGVATTDDRLGAVGTASQLAPGHSVTFHVDRTLSATAVWVTNTATATASDPSGRTVRATDAASVTIVADASKPSRGPGNDGTAFTGTDAGDATLLGLVLAIVGLALLRAARTRA